MSSQSSADFPFPQGSQVALDSETLYRQFYGQDPLIAPHARFVFDVVEKLGEGGMGAVYKVNDTRLSRLAALKMLSQSQDNQHAQSRFLREAMITARLDHPAIPSVYEAGRTAGGELYLLMKLIEGQTLRERIDLLHDDGCPQPELLELLGALARVGEAIAYAHSQGIIHRDLKPENIMIGAFGEVLVIDWGIAKDQQDSQTEERQLRSQLQLLGELAKIPDGLTAAGSFLGTPGYAAPEQLDGEELGERADVFALGLILTEILTGEAAIPGETGTNKVRALASGKVMTPRQLRRSVPRSLDWIARQAVQFQVKDRTRSAALFVEQLKAWLADQPIPRYRYGLGERMTRFVRRRPASTLTLVTGSLALMLVAVLATVLRDAEKKSAELNVAKLEEKKAKTAAQSAQEVTELFNKAQNLANRRGNRDALKLNIDKALSLSKRSYPQLLRAASIYKDAAWEDEQKACLKEAAKKHPPAYEALFSLHLMDAGEGSLGLKRTWAVNELVRRAEEQGQENEFTLFIKGSEAQTRGALREAMDYYDRALQYSTRFASLHNHRGNTKNALGDKKGAFEEFSKAIEINPKHAFAYSNRGNLRIAMGDRKGALADLTKSIEINPNGSGAYNNRGVVLKIMGRRRQAETDYKRAIQLDPKNASAYHNLGIVQVELKEREAAMKSFNKALQINPRFVTVYCSRATLKKMEGDKRGAIEDYSRALKLDPRSLNALVFRGLLYDDVGEKRAALKDLQSFLKLCPKNSKFENLRGKVKVLEQSLLKQLKP